MPVSTHQALGRAHPPLTLAGFSPLAGVCPTAPQTRAAASCVTSAPQGRRRMFIGAIVLIMQISPCFNYFKALKIYSGICKRTSRAILSPRAHGTGSRSTSQPQMGICHLCLPVPGTLFPGGKETQVCGLERSCDTCIYIYLYKRFNIRTL